MKHQSIKYIIVLGLLLSPWNLSGNLSKDEKNKFSKAFPEEINNTNFPQMIESFDYPDANIKDVVKAISKLTGKNFILDDKVKGKISIVAPSPITVAEAYRAFLSALAMNRLTVVPSGKFLKIKPAKDAKKDSIDIYSGKYFPNSDQMITRVVRLKHSEAKKMETSIKALISGEGSSSSFEFTNSIIITDFGSNIERIMKVIAELDVPGFSEDLHVLEIVHARAADIAKLITTIISGGNKGSTSSLLRSRLARFRQGRGSSTKKESLSLVVADERTNSIIVVGNATGIQKIRHLIRKLDTPLKEGEEGGAYVYTLKHGQAKNIAKILTDLNKSSSPSSLRKGQKSNPLDQVAKPIFQKDIKVIADENTNSLIITAGFQDYKSILKILKKIDVAKDQVHVKVVIMQVNAANTQSWSVNVYNFLENTGGIGRVGLVTGDLTSMLNPSKDSGAVFGFGEGKQVSINVGGTSIKVPEVTSFINFLKTQAQTHLLSSTRLHAMDNEEAEWESGREIPAGVERAQAASGDSTIVASKRQKVTVNIKFTPQVNKASNTVKMKIEQTANDYDQASFSATDVDNPLLITTLQSIKTTIVVKSGETAILGGLIKNKDSSTTKKVPFLGDIPFLGWLFKGKGSQIDKENLLVFITPTIIESDEHLGSLARDVLNKEKKGLSKVSQKFFSSFLEEFAQASSSHDNNPLFPIESGLEFEEAPEPDVDEEISVEEDLGLDLEGEEAADEESDLESEDENISIETLLDDDKLKQNLKDTQEDFESESIL